MMQAIVQDRYGSADVLSLRAVDRPAIGKGEVLIRVRAAGFDPGVWHLMTGTPYLMRLFGTGFFTPKVRTPGMDVAGVVEAVGEGVTAFQKGDEVFGAASGSFAEYACARADKLALKPATVSFEEAAAVPISASTALEALRNAGRIQEGQSVLVIGAGGGVGTFAVQLAKAFGAEVTGVCSTAKVELVRSIGADHVIDYTREALTGRYDLILDTAGNRPLAILRRLLTPAGTLVIVGGEGARWSGVGRPLGALVLNLFVRQRLKSLFSIVRKENLEFLKELIEAGKLTSVIDRTYPLSEAPEAVRAWEKGHARGKSVIAV